MKAKVPGSQESHNVAWYKRLRWHSGFFFIIIIFLGGSRRAGSVVVAHGL